MPAPCLPRYPTKIPCLPPAYQYTLPRYPAFPLPTKILYQDTLPAPAYQDTPLASLPAPCLPYLPACLPAHRPLQASVDRSAAGAAAAAAAASGGDAAAATGSPHRFALSIAYAPDGSRVACGASDGTVAVWDCTTLQPLCVCEGHTKPVRSLSFMPGAARRVHCIPDEAAVWLRPTHNRACQERPVWGSHARGRVDAGRAQVCGLNPGVVGSAQVCGLNLGGVVGAAQVYGLNLGGVVGAAQ
eukprot:352437-Chlamydomonas_euryale.AAC.1